MEDGVETYVAKSEFIDGRLKLRLAIRADQSARIIRANREIEEPVDGWTGLRHVDHYRPGAGDGAERRLAG
jgi:hypothetical protein